MEATNSSTEQAAGAAQEAKSQATAVAGTASAQTAEVASAAVDSTKQVAAVGHQEARDIATAATEQAANVAGAAATQARNLVDESKQQLRSQAQSQTDQIASKLRELGDQVQALVEGRTEDAGPVGDYARQAAQSVTQFAGRIEERGLDGVVDDVQRFARRKPGTFLLGAALAGFGVGRLLRSGAVTQQSAPGAAHVEGALPPQEQAALEAAAYAPYDAVGVTTQPSLVDVSDGTVAGMSSLDATDGTIADATVVDPLNDAGRIR